MAWTSPTTVVAGTLITASWGNTDVRDNTLHLYNNRSIFDTQIRRNSTISPSPLGAHTHNWNPTGLATANRIRIDLSTSIDLSGIVAQPNGTEILLMNVAGGTVTLKHQESSSAANQFYIAGATSFPMVVGDVRLITYDTDKWRVAL